MSVAGFIAAMGGQNVFAAPNKGFSSWMPGFTTRLADVFDRGQSRSHRGGADNLGLAGTADTLIYTKPFGQADYRLATVAYYVGAQTGEADEAIQGQVWFYYGVDNAGGFVPVSVDTTLLTETLGGVVVLPTLVFSPTQVFIRTTNGSATAGGNTGVLNFAVWTTTFERQVGDQGGCFVAGTLVMTPHGSSEIQQLNKGDVVWAYSHSRHRVVEAEVLAAHVHEQKEIWELVLEGVPAPLLVTDNHPFWVTHRAQYVPAGALEPGCELLDLQGGVARVLELKKTGEQRTVYNFTVADHSNYFVGPRGVLVHNK